MQYFSSYKQVTHSDNLKVAIAQLCNELQFCNFTML